MQQTSEQLIAEAEAALRAGNRDNARTLYQTVLDKNPASASALYGVGSLEMQEKNYHEALPYFTQASEIEPHAVDIAYKYAVCLAQLGKKTQALDELQRAARYCADDPVFCPIIADLLLKLNEASAAIQLLSRLQTPSPKNMLAMAQAHGHLGNWQNTIDLLKPLSQSLPNDPNIANELAIAAAKTRDYPTAITAFERYLELVPTAAKNYLRFADLQLMAKNLDACDKAVQQALELGEDGAEIYVLQAKVARLRANYAVALSALDKALAREPGHGRAWSLRIELSTPEQLAELSKELQTVLEHKEELAKLDYHQQALLYFSLFQIEHRNHNFPSAALALRQANQIQFEQLLKEQNSYDPANSVQQTDALINNFNKSVFTDGATESSYKNEFKPIFIVGMPRSGTTLVERILGQNEQVQNGGEQEGMEFVGTEYQQKIANGTFTAVEKISPAQWSELRETYIRKLPNISKPVFTDKLPHNFRHVGLILKLFPDAKIIQMHRSIQDVCFSIYSHVFPLAHNYATRLPDLIHFYSECERLMAHWTGLQSPQILNLSYEDLVQQPEHYAKQLVEFCDLPWNPTYLDFHESISQSFTFSEMQVREPIASKRIGRWRDYVEYLSELADI